MRKYDFFLFDDEKYEPPPKRQENVRKIFIYKL